MAFQKKIVFRVVFAFQIICFLEMLPGEVLTFPGGMMTIGSRILVCAALSRF